MKIPHVAVILAAGVGARLDRPDTPKALIKVGNKPLIVWNIEQLQEAGVADIYVVLGHRGEEIKKELTNNPFVTAQINYVYEEDVSKAGIIKILGRLPEIISEPFFITMADLFIEHNPYKIFERRISGLSDVETKHIYTLVDVRPEQILSSGAQSQVQLSENAVADVGRSLEVYSGVEVGVYYVGAEGIALLAEAKNPAHSFASLNDFLLFLAEKNSLHSVLIQEGEWFDVNTPATHIKAEMFARSLLSSTFLLPLKKNLKPMKPTTAFSRHKNLSTDIIIETGSLDRIQETKIIPDSSANTVHFLLTDEVVDGLHAEKVLLGFRAAGYDVKKLVVPVGEKSKSISEFTRLAEEIFSQGMDKHSYIISLGGGVVNNIAGFLASTLYRGIGLIHIPTTTMAQVDAAIDFKQGINSTKGKNLFGSYYPATSIVIDPRVLLTLDDRNMVNGLSESIKHALTQDEGFLDYLLKNRKNLRDVAVLEEIVRKTVGLKVPLLNGDVQNDFNEMIPQYGHSIGHAVERLSSYELLHGEAIAIGMCISAEIAFILGVCSKEIVDVHYKAFKEYDLPVSIPASISVDDMIAAMRFDKHHVEKPYMALVARVGDMFHEKKTYGIPVDYEIVRRAFKINKEKHHEG